VLELETEHLLRLADAGQHLPPRRGGRRPHPATFYRWAKAGLRGVRLETIRVGGSLCTSREALHRFCERLTEAEGPSPQAPVPASPASRRRAAERAGRFLDRIGI
jgi:hypothetical protein